jgi:hypothetical protein
VLLTKFIAGLASGDPLEYIVGGGSGDWSGVQSQLSGISSEIGTVNNNVLSTAQALTCTANGTKYSGAISGTNQDSINLIGVLYPAIQKIASDRANNQDPTADINTLYSDENGQPVSTIADDLYSAALGSGAPANTTGALQNLSTVLTTCHTYFNYDDSQGLLDSWAWFMMLQGEACVVEVNYIQNGFPPNNIGPGDPTAAEQNCTSYANSLNTLPITQQITNQNEVIDVKTGIPWLLDTTNGNSCGNGSDDCMYSNVTPCSGSNCTNCGSWAFVSGGLQKNSSGEDVGDWLDYCTLPAKGWVPEQPGFQSYVDFTGRSQNPWQVLPYYQDIQTFLNDSLCPGTSGGNQSTLVTCLNTWGFEVPSNPPFQIWADSTPYFAGYKPAYETSGNGVCAAGVNGDPGDGTPGCNASFYNYGDVTSYWSTTASNSGGIAISGIDPPCWTYGYDVSAEYDAHWECGYVDASANFNQAGAPEAAWFLYEWVGPGAANGAQGLPVTLNDYVLPGNYVPKVSPAVVGAGRPAPITLSPTPRATAIPVATASPTPTPRPTETPAATPRAEATAPPAETPKPASASPTETPRPAASASPTETPKPAATTTPRP